jgi:hypothetical protein
MNIGAIHALPGGSYLPRPARDVAGVADVAGARRPRPPVERIVEGEVLGRDDARFGASAQEFVARMRTHAHVEQAHGPQQDVWNRAALATYAGIASAQGVRASSSRIDIYA